MEESEEPRCGSCIRPTHLFDSHSDCLNSDAVFGVKESLIRDFVPGEDGLLRCESDFVLHRAGEL